MSFGEEEKFMRQLFLYGNAAVWVPTGHETSWGTGGCRVADDEVLHNIEWLTVDEAVARIRGVAGDGRLLVRRWMRQKAVAERRRIRRRKHGY